MAWGTAAWGWGLKGRGACWGLAAGWLGVSAGKEAGKRGRLWKVGRGNRGKDRDEGREEEGREEEGRLLIFLLVLAGRILLLTEEIFRGALVTGEIPSNSSRPGTAKGVSTLLYAAMPSASPRRLPCLMFTLPSTCSTSTTSCLMSSQPSSQACPPSPRPTAPPTRSRRRLDASDTATMA